MKMEAVIEPNIQKYQAFLLAVELGSFTEAAIRLMSYAIAYALMTGQRSSENTKVRMMYRTV